MSPETKKLLLIAGSMFVIAVGIVLAIFLWPDSTSDPQENIWYITAEASGGAPQKLTVDLAAFGQSKDFLDKWLREIAEGTESGEKQKSIGKVSYSETPGGKSTSYPFVIVRNKLGDAQKYEFALGKEIRPDADPYVQVNLRDLSNLQDVLYKELERELKQAEENRRQGRSSAVTPP